MQARCPTSSTWKPSKRRKTAEWRSPGSSFRKQQTELHFRIRNHVFDLPCFSTQQAQDVVSKANRINREVSCSVCALTRMMRCAYGLPHFAGTQAHHMPLLRD